jgi:hypothetical protein
MNNLGRHCEERSDEAIQNHAEKRLKLVIHRQEPRPTSNVKGAVSFGSGLLRCARNDGWTGRRSQTRSLFVP